MLLLFDKPSVKKYKIPFSAGNLEQGKSPLLRALVKQT